MREKIWTVIGGIGWILLLGAASAMDSEQMMIPICMAAVGIALCCISAKEIMVEEE